MLNRHISIAPMMGYTDRHFRYMMRGITKHTLLYTEMVTTGAILQGEAKRALNFSPTEQPLALQVGGSDPTSLAKSAVIAEELGYREVNLNVGCPSPRVSSGYFGACLMLEPQQVAACVAAMSAAVTIPVTIKTRIGVDDHDSYEQLLSFVAMVAAHGCQTFIIHARKAWLKGLSPKENRTIPPLCYETVYRLKQDFPELEIIINGGIKTFSDMEEHLQYLDGVMVGREACVNPMLFASADKCFYDDDAVSSDILQVLEHYLPYVSSQMKAGICVHHLTRHLSGLFRGQKGSKHWRNHLHDYSGNIVNSVNLMDLAKKIVSEGGLRY